MPLPPVALNWLASAKAPSSSAKAVRNPAKSALLARMAAPTGRDRGFAVHKAPDKVGRSAVRCC
jgi:hypothetical protein